MATSTIPALKGNLVTRLQARGGLSGVQVAYGPPFPNPQRELIAVGPAEGQQVWQTFGTTTGLRREEYDLAVLISVLREGIDAQAADTRCFQLYAELENEIRSDPTIGAVAKALIGDFKLEEGIAPDGMSRESRLTVQVSCEAFI